MRRKTIYNEMGYFEELSQHSCQKQQECVMIASLQVKIQAGYLPNTSQMPKHFISLAYASVV
jgi:hypothetical protein